MNDQEQEQLETTEGLIGDTPPTEAAPPKADDNEVEIPHKTEDVPEQEVQPASNSN